MYIYLVGKPCSGKDTVARFIDSEYAFKHIVIGRLIGDHIQNVYGPDSDEMKKYNAGYIIDRNLAHDLLKNIITENRNSKNDNLLFDGFPRTESQFNMHMEFVSAKIKKLFLILNISNEEAMARMFKRLICSVCTKTQVDNGQKVCQFCTSDALYRRQDDKEDSMKVRLSEFEEKTSYILNLKNDQSMNIVVHFIDVNNKDIDAVLQEVDTIIQKNVS